MNLDEQTKEFLDEVNKRIDRELISKLKLIGYDKEDLFSNDPKNRPTMTRVTLVSNSDIVHQRYAANKIRLFDVIWTKEEVKIVDTTV